MITTLIITSIIFTQTGILFFMMLLSYKMKKDIDKYRDLSEQLEYKLIKKRFNVTKEDIEKVLKQRASLAN